MTWCERCLLDHAGPCLDQRRQRDFVQVLAGRSDACPYCGVEGNVCPVESEGSRSLSCPALAGRQRSSAS